MNVAARYTTAVVGLAVGGGAGLISGFALQDKVSGPKALGAGALATVLAVGALSPVHRILGVPRGAALTTAGLAALTGAALIGVGIGDLGGSLARVTGLTASAPGR